MKKFSIFSIIQIALFTILAILVTISFVGSVIQAGEFYSWQIVYGVLVITTYFLVYTGVKEAKKESEK